MTLSFRYVASDPGLQNSSWTLILTLNDAELPIVRIDLQALILENLAVVYRLIVSRDLDRDMVLLEATHYLGLSVACSVRVQ